MIDWDVAISTGVKFARQGPEVSLAEARAVVAELRGLTAVVQQPVRELTGLTSQGDIGPVAVVDRPGWIKANVGGVRVVLEPLTDKLSSRGGLLGAGPVTGAITSRVTGVEAGLLLAYLSSRVLGQYELFLPRGEGAAASAAGTAGAGEAGSTTAAASTSGFGASTTNAAANSAGTNGAGPSGSTLVPGGASVGRLTLAAPNIVMIERELGVDP